MRKQLCFLLFIGLTPPVYSQTDSLIFAGAFEEKTAKEGGAALYNGREHIGYPSTIEGTAYFEANEWLRETVVVQGVPYRNVLLKYDVVADEVIVLHPNGFTGVTLFTPRVQSFTLNNRRFVYLTVQQSSGLKAGIYEELILGMVSLYVKRSKIIQEAVVSNSRERKFIDQPSYFLLKDGRFYPAKNEKSILNLLNEKRKEVADWMKTSGVNYKANPEDAMVKIIAYYNQLSR